VPAKPLPLIAGNWKMHQTQAAARALAREICQGLTAGARVEVVLAPPFTALAAVAQELAHTPVGLAGQDAFWERQGAYTGAISPWMLKDLGCRYVIIGHSERRHYFGDTDDLVNRKVKAALEAGLKVILCIGETLKEREDDATLQVVREQLRLGLAGIPPSPEERLVIAYEPVWAIGTGRTATPDQAQEVHHYIRRLAAETLDLHHLRILYGGSVTPENAGSLLTEPDLNGALVGGASLKAASFLKIVTAAA